MPKLVEEEEPELDACTQQPPHETCTPNKDPADALAELLALPAEVMIGIHEDESQDPIDLMVVFQKNL